MNKPENIFCRICGYEYPVDNPAWYDDESPSHDICICCGVEFGYDDTNYKAVLDYRNHWLNSGAKWFSPGKRPKDWILEEQLKSIPERWR